MTKEEVRLACLRLVAPEGIANPDPAFMVDRAKVLEAYVLDAGNAEAPAEKSTLRMPDKPGQPGSDRPRHK